MHKTRQFNILWDNKIVQIFVLILIGVSTFLSLSYYAPAENVVGKAAENQNRMENSYHFFSASGTDYMVIVLEFGPRDEVLEWANQIVSNNQEKKAIIVTHNYMYNDDTRSGSGDSWNPHNYGISNVGTVNDGEEMWEKLVRKHKNIEFVFSGHVLGDGTGRLVSAGDNGNIVYQMLANYQTLENGGNGFMRLLELVPSEKKVLVRTYSPYINAYTTDAENEFVIDMENGVFIQSPTEITRAVAARMIIKRSGTAIDTAGGPHFADVPTTHPEYSYIETIYNKQITSGCATNPLRYCPSEAATRGAFVVFVVKARQLSTPDCTSAPFRDVPVTHQFCRYVQAAKAEGFIAGYSDGTFRPDEKINFIDANTISGRAYNSSFFTLVVLPDTQLYSQDYPEIFTAQTEWIEGNVNQKNIKFVLHEGDITNRNTHEQWDNAKNSIKILDGVVPYALALGNHDIDDGWNASSRSTFFNEYFKFSDYRNLSTFGGIFPYVSDTTIPFVVITQPAGGATVSGTTSVQASASDNAAVQKVEFYLDNVLKHTDTDISYAYLWDTSTVANGAHTLKAKAYDTSGNTAENTISVTVNNVIPDITPPSVAVTMPANGQTISGAVEVQATATDNIAVQKVEFYVDGSLKLSDTTSPYSYNLDTSQLTNAQHTIISKAYDTSNNQAQHQITVTVSNVVQDTAPPSVFISSHANNEEVSGTVDIQTSASDNVAVQKVEFYVDNVLKLSDTTAPYTYSWITSTVVNGAHTVKAKVYDTSSNTNEHQITLVVNNIPPDITPPTVQITSPANGNTVAGLTDILASASDNIAIQKVEFYIDGVLKLSDTSSPYSYLWDTTIASNTQHTIQAKAYDINGNQNSNSMTVTVSNAQPDTTAPTVTITSPSNSILQNTVTVTTSASDNIGVVKVEFFLNGTLKSTDTSSPYAYSFDTKLIENGAYVIQTKAYDAASNSQTDEKFVTVNNAIPDATAPSVFITQPANQSKVSSRILIIAEATDNVGIDKIEFFVNNALKFTDNTAPYNYSFDTTSVANGTHRIKAKAYDKSTNSAIYEISINAANVAVDTVKPTVLITSPASQAKVTGLVTVTAIASDNVGVQKVEFFVNGSLKLSDTTSPYEYIWNTSNYSEVSHMLQAKAYDTSGNNGIHSLRVSVNRTIPDIVPPSIQFNSHQNSSIVSGTIILTVLPSDNVGVQKVKFYLDGTYKIEKASYPFAYILDTLQLSNGIHSVIAEALDTSGNLASTSIQISVNNKPSLIDGDGSGRTKTNQTQPTVNAALTTQELEDNTYKVVLTLQNTGGSGHVSFVIDYGDGTNETFTAPLEAGETFVKVLAHKYAEDGTYSIRAMLASADQALELKAEESVSVVLDQTSDILVWIIVVFVLTGLAGSISFVKHKAKHHEEFE